MPEDNSSTRSTPIVPVAIRSLMDKRPLLFGDSAGAYDNLFMAIAEVIQPRNTIEWLYVKSFTDVVWELQNYRRLIPILINNARIKAATVLLMDTEPGLEVLNHNLGAQYVCADSPRGPAARNRMAKHGRDEQSVLAEAFSQQLPNLEAADRVISMAEARLERILQDIDRYRASLGRQFRELAADNDNAEVSRRQVKKKPSAPKAG